MVAKDKATKHFVTLLNTTYENVGRTGALEARTEMAQILRDAGMLNWAAVVTEDGTRAYEKLFDEGTFENSSAFVDQCMKRYLGHIFHDMDKAKIKRKELFATMIGAWEGFDVSGDKDTPSRIVNLRKSIYNARRFTVLQSFIHYAPESVIVKSNETKNNRGEAFLLYVADKVISGGIMECSMHKLARAITKKFNRSLTEKEIQFFGQHLSHDVVLMLNDQGVSGDHKVKINGCPGITEIPFVELGALKGLSKVMTLCDFMGDRKSMPAWVALKEPSSSYQDKTKKTIKKTLSQIASQEGVSDARILRDGYGIPADWWCFKKNPKWLNNLVDTAVTNPHKNMLGAKDSAGHGLCFHMWPTLFSGDYGGAKHTIRKYATPENEILDGDGLIAQWYKDERTMETCVMEPVSSMPISHNRSVIGSEDITPESRSFTPVEMWDMSVDSAECVANHWCHMSPENEAFILFLFRAQTFCSDTSDAMWSRVSGAPEWQHLRGAMIALLLKQTRLILEKKLYHEATSNSWSHTNGGGGSVRLVGFIVDAVQKLQSPGWKFSKVVNDAIKREAELGPEWEHALDYLDESDRAEIKDMLSSVTRKEAVVEREAKVATGGLGTLSSRKRVASRAL